MSEWHPLSVVVLTLLALAVPLTVGAAIVKVVRERKEDRKEDRKESVVVARAAEMVEERFCPCGRRATRARPRYRVWRLPLFGRIVFRQTDSFAEHEVCDEHAEVANTVIDEQIALANLTAVRAERDRFTQLANSNDVVQEVVQSLPEEKRKAYKVYLDKQRAHERSLRTVTAVAVLRASNDDTGTENQGPNQTTQLTKSGDPQ